MSGSSRDCHGRWRFRSTAPSCNRLWKSGEAKRATCLRRSKPCIIKPNATALHGVASSMPRWKGHQRDKPAARDSRNPRHSKNRRVSIMKSQAGQAKGPESKPESKLNAKNDLKSVPMPELEKTLGSSPDGLSKAEAEKRLTRYGPNEIQEQKTNPFLKLLTYFWGPIPWMIEAAVILSGVVRHWPDFFIILLLLVSNAVVGFWEERQAGNAIAALKAKLAITALVKRDGKWITPAA